MISDIYYRNRQAFPILSVVFIISCLLVTIPSYVNPLWYEVFGGAKDYTYIWQVFTHNLEHGHPFPTQLPTLAHLAMNILVIATCGVLSERILGKTRFWLLTVGALALSTGGRFLNIYGNGASTIAWSYIPAAAYSMYLLYRRNPKKLVRDPLLVLFTVVIFVAWVLITSANFALGWHDSNVLHLVGSVYGAICAIIWRKHLATNVTHPEKKRSKWDRPITVVTLLLPVFLVGVFVLAGTGVLSTHVPPAFVVDIVPASGFSIYTVNDACGKIEFHFPEIMATHNDSTSVTTHTLVPDPLHTQSTWLDGRTLEVRLTRLLQDGERLEIRMSGFYLATGQRVAGEVAARYGF